MKLAFYAKDDDLVYVPDFPRTKGAAPQRVGRSFIPGDGVKGAQHPATAEPFVCDSEDANGVALLAAFRRGRRALWPADKATAEACGVEFVAVEVKDGVAIPKVAPAPQPAARKGARDEA